MRSSVFTLLCIAVVASSVHAADWEASWSAPTNYTDGTPLGTNVVFYTLRCDYIENAAAVVQTLFVPARTGLLQRVVVGEIPAVAAGWRVRAHGSRNTTSRWSQATWTGLIISPPGIVRLRLLSSLPGKPSPAPLAP